MEAKKLKTKECSADDCKCRFPVFNSLQKYCSVYCASKNQKPPKPRIRRPIKQYSTKQAKLNVRYAKVRKYFLERPENKICPVTKEPTTDIHHKRGRVGYADDWARKHDIPLMVDERYFLAVSRNGHNYIEKNVDWAIENGYSEKRHTKESIR